MKELATAIYQLINVVLTILCTLASIAFIFLFWQTVFAIPLYYFLNFIIVPVFGGSTFTFLEATLLNFAILLIYKGLTHK